MVFIASFVADVGLLGITAAALVLISALWWQDSLRRRRSVAAMLPSLIGAALGGVITAVGALASWRLVPEAGAAAASVCLAQVVYNLPWARR